MNKQTVPSQKILVVEDDTALSDAYTMILSSAAYDVRPVYNGREALTALDEFTPDLILLDLRMPKMGGLEFLKTANLSARLPETKIIVFSNYDVQRDIDESFSYGATKYVLKSWASPKELLKLVSDVLESE